jgi:AraC-like DNA-binding protein
MVRLHLVMPLVQELERLRIDAGEPLAQLSVRRKDVENRDVFVPAPKMYAIVEKLAEFSGDLYFGVHVGERLDPWNWSPMLDAARQSVTVGEFLLRFMDSAQNDESSVTYILKTSGNRTSLREQRITDGGVVPRHNDGFTIAYLAAIFRRALGPDWDGRRVVARVCDPQAIPGNYLGMKVGKHDTFGASIHFPTRWLIKKLRHEAEQPAEYRAAAAVLPAATMVESFQQALTPHIHESDLTVARAALICGMSSRTLARRLQRHGTSVHKELEALRRDHAAEALRKTDRPVGEIAGLVGYPNPSVFSRAFRRWTGISPREYRRQSRRA